MTDKEIVLAKYPDAKCYELDGFYAVYAGVCIGFGNIESEAWADAAAKLKEPT